MIELFGVTTGDRCQRQPVPECGGHLWHSLCSVLILLRLSQYLNPNLVSIRFSEGYDKPL